LRCEKLETVRFGKNKGQTTEQGIYPYQAKHYTLHAPLDKAAESLRFRQREQGRESILFDRKKTLSTSESTRNGCIYGGFATNDNASVA